MTYKERPQRPVTFETFHQSDDNFGQFWQLSHFFYIYNNFDLFFFTILTLLNLFDNFLQFLTIFDNFDNFWQILRFWQFFDNFFLCFQIRRKFSDILGVFRVFEIFCDLRHDTWDTNYISDNWEQQYGQLHCDLWIESDGDSIRNSCDVLKVKDWF